MEKEIYFLGIGGAGCHILDRLAGMGFGIGRSIAIDSDRQVLNTLKYCRDTLMISDKFSTAGNIDTGMAFFEANKDKILGTLSNAKTVFLIAGLGGGTGSAGMLALTSWLNQLHIPVITLVILPFSVEGELKGSKAKNALLEIKAKSYISIVFDNDNIIKHHGSIPMQKALLASDIRQMKNLLFEIALLKGYNKDEAIQSLNLGREDYDLWMSGRSSHDSTFNLQIDNKYLNWFTPYEIEMIIRDFAKKYPARSPAELVTLIHQDPKFNKLFIYPSDIAKVISSGKSKEGYKDIYLDMFSVLRSATLEITDKLNTKLMDWVELKLEIEGKQKSIGIVYLVDAETNNIVMRQATKTQINKLAIFKEFGDNLRPDDKIIIPDYKYFNNLHNSGDKRIYTANVSQLGYIMQIKKYLKGILQENSYTDKEDLHNFLNSYTYNYNNTTKYDTIFKY